MGPVWATLRAEGAQLFTDSESIWHCQMNKSLHKLITHAHHTHSHWPQANSNERELFPLSHGGCGHVIP